MMEKVVSTQRTFFRKGKTRNISFRKEQLKNIKSILKDNEDAIFQALDADLHKPAFETYETELLITYQEIDHILSNIDQWAAPQKVNGSLFNFPSQNHIYQQPYGVTLVIGAWNYPLQLTLNPALGSMAAGNATIMKPSELAPNTSGLLAELINDNFEPGYLTVVEGDAETTQALLSQPLDYIFFTGSSRVGKIIMTAAAEQLTPVTLELGGKSPAIIDASADLPVAAKRIAWGKFINAGQTCVSPDYVYVDQSIEDQFCELLQQYITEFYGDDVQQSPDYARIINNDHFNRLTNFIDPEKVYHGGATDSADRYIEPTILSGISWDDDVMQEEIFGPILPVLTFEHLDEVCNSINTHPDPLALYIFSSNRETQDNLIQSISFGGGCINDTVAHLGNLELPFGGVGNSGFGNYHGKASFDLFSHSKSIMRKKSWPDIPLRYPPYDGNLKWLRKLSNLL
ncbi:aldehyde dehydrogenase [Fodinibius halophilus]|uniref:Aldehyde dehydrogenase n=1 Tax=Fodinibius halophilus TaxID=1736908 RepID=A0A6M1T5P6_9BACT|nr:aldehyde dehydrogenase [Fodinibius halophilus]NGP88595.1 aldehyde dehydrogenase [Fodinibius halophilus]